MESKTLRLNNTGHLLSLRYLILIGAFVAFGCGRDANKRKGTVPASSLTLHAGNDDYYLLDTSHSLITWKGASLNGLNVNAGYMYFSKGEVKIQSGQVIGGTMEVDMNTIEDKNHSSDNKLVHHLKDADFFEVDTFPFATIVIRDVASEHNGLQKITGDLTVKGITHPVNFLAHLSLIDGNVTGDGKLVIDRTKWNVRYKSAKFFKILANQTMSDLIELNITIVAKHQ